MKKLLLIVAAAVLTTTTFAQTAVENKLLKADAGFGTGVNGMVPFGVSYEQGVYSFNDGSFITAGGYFGYAGKVTNYVGYKWKLRIINVMAQGNYYFKPLVDKMDVYAGIRLGYAGINSKHKFDNGNDYDYDWGDPFGYDVHAGVNYWFTKFIGANAEIGYGIAYFNIGVAFKF